MSDNIDRSWKLYSDGELFAAFSENGDDAPSFTFVQDQVGGDGKPMHFTNDALRTVRDAIDEYLRINMVEGRPSVQVASCPEGQALCTVDGGEVCATHEPDHWAVRRNQVEPHADEPEPSQESRA